MCWEESEVIEKLNNTVDVPENQMQSYNHNVVTLLNPTIAALYKVETYKCLRCSSRRAIIRNRSKVLQCPVWHSKQQKLL